MFFSVSDSFFFDITIPASPISYTWSMHATWRDADHCSGLIGRYLSRNAIASLYAAAPSIVSTLLITISGSPFFFFFWSAARYCSVWLYSFKPLNLGTTFLRWRTTQRGSFLTLLMSSNNSCEKFDHLSSGSHPLIIMAALLNGFLNFYWAKSDMVSDFWYSIYKVLYSDQLDDLSARKLTFSNMVSDSSLGVFLMDLPAGVCWQFSELWRPIA